MKKLILSLVFVLAFVAVTPASAKNNIKNNKSIDLVLNCIDCNEYAANAADQEVGFWENAVSQGLAYLYSYNFWYGYCESAALDSTVLDPVFIEK